MKGTRSPGHLLEVPSGVIAPGARAFRTAVACNLAKRIGGPTRGLSKTPAAQARSLSWSWPASRMDAPRPAAPSAAKRVPGGSMSGPAGRFALAIVALAIAVAACGDEKGVAPAPSTKELDSPGLLGATAGSENYIHAFVNTGMYPYHCQYHTTSHHRMAGTVVVGETGPDSAFISI